MRAFYVEAPGKYGVIDRPVPEIGEEEVLVKVECAAICHSDLDKLSGARKHLNIYPTIAGHEFAGTISKVGSKVVGLKEGDKVTCECMTPCGHCRACDLGMGESCKNYTEIGFMRDGAFAEYCAVPVRNCHQFTKMSMEQASLCEPVGNGVAICEKANIQTTDTVVIIGPGPIGLYAMLCARLRHPSRIIMVGTRYNRLKYAEGIADALINIREEDAAKRIMEITEGKGADVVLMCAATTAACELAMEIAGNNCRIIIEGCPSDDPVSVNFSNFIAKQWTIRGSASANARQFREVIGLVEGGYLDPMKFVTHILPLEEIEKGFEILKARNQDAVKILIKP